MSQPSDLGPADRIRQHLAGVESLRVDAHRSGSSETVMTIKRLQAVRFRHTYNDFLHIPEYASAARFFLEELYGVRDFSVRDRQFSRIAVGLEALFPAAVAELAVDMTELHVLTERLDHGMAMAWQATPTSDSMGTRYQAAWQLTGTPAERQRQLTVVFSIGKELQALVRKRGIRTALRLMRSPARAAGLESLQAFLEAGFDAFASMKDATFFMETIRDREQVWITRLFDTASDTCSQSLSAIWSQESSAA